MTEQRRATAQQERRLLELLELLRDEVISDRQFAELQDLVINDPAACKTYVDAIELQGNLEWTQDFIDTQKPALESTTSERDDEPDDLLLGLSLLSSAADQSWGCLLEEENDSPTEGNLGFFGSINFSFLPGLIMVISSMLILVALVVMPIYWTTRPAPKWDLVALVTNTVDCHWKQDGLKPTSGCFLALGQKLELEYGLAELEFASGAKVILEGPAEFTVVGNNASNLGLGRLAATVPEGAQGFTVATPDLEIVDLGTEFGVAVEDGGNTDVHVFKGMVETKIMDSDESLKIEIREPEKKKKREPKRKLRLEKNQAIQYDKNISDVVSIPFNRKRFVRSLDRSKGVVANLRVTNPSFEYPNIRTVSQYQPILGSTLFRPIYGWKMSDNDPTKSRVAMYQVSPFTSSNADCNVGPGATEGCQVAVISLGVKPSSAGKPRSNWIYQSLGIITAADVNKKLKLTADAGPRSVYGSHPQGGGVIHAAFALHVDSTQSGTFLGKPDSFCQTEAIKQLHRLEATVTITREWIGQELFILLAVSDNNTGQSTFQYHFDNVKVVED